MKIVIIGSEGNIGRRLKSAFPDSVGIDIKPGADIRANLEFIDYEDRDVRRAFDVADTVIHLATSGDPTASADIHWQDVENAARLFSNCVNRGITRLVVASSDLAAPKSEDELTTFSHCKRVLEIMTAMFDHEEGCCGRPVRIGWVPADKSEVKTAAPDLRARYWSDKRLVAAFRRGLGLPRDTAPEEKE